MSSTVQVLLATYQGERFLPAQVESIRQQTYPHVRLFARDDGSQDGTPAILEAYAQAGVLAWQQGQNMGVVRSFDWLLRHSPQSDYYAYCDQDDVWHPEKLQRAVAQLNALDSSIPSLYFTATALVDEHLTPLNRVQPVLLKPASFANALVQNVVTGCTCVINHSARELLTRVMPEWSQIRMHDWWAYLVVSGHGQVLFDAFQSVQYRQHGKNQVGTKNLTLRNRLSRFWHNEGVITRQAHVLYKHYKDTLQPEARQLLEQFLRKELQWYRGIQLAFTSPLYRQKTLDHWLLKGLLCLNRL